MIPLLCSFQSPVEVPGVSNSDFLRLAANARRKQLGQEELGPLEFYGYVMPKVRAPVKPCECHWVAVVCPLLCSRQELHGIKEQGCLTGSVQG